MKNSAASLKSHILQYGIMLGAISVVFALMLFFLDMHYTQESAANWINYIITTSIIILGIYNFRRANEGFLSLSESLKIGLGISVIGGIIGVLYTVLLINFLDPDTIEKTLEVTQNKMIDANPEISQAQLDQMREMQEKFSGIGIISTMIMVFSLFFGFIISLIGGLILRRNRPE